MAILWFGHFDSTADDRRLLTAERWAEYIKSFITDGVRNYGKCLQITARGEMKVYMDVGIANIQGYIFKAIAEAKVDGNYYEIPLPPSDNTFERIDRLVLRLDKTIENRLIKPCVVMGTASKAPIAPKLTRDNDIWELSLAQIRRMPKDDIVTHANITDERTNTELCGIMNSVLGLDPSVWQEQFDRFIKGIEDLNTDFLAERLGQFNEQLQRQQADYHELKAQILLWKNMSLSELTMALAFCFDNQFAHVGTVKETTETDGGCMSILKWKANNKLLAEQSTEEMPDGSIEITQKAYDMDNSVYRHAKMIITETDGKIISEVVDV